MGSRQEIEFIIHPDGSIRERVSGVTGHTCEEITEKVEKALGEIARRQHTSEYYQDAESTSDTLTTLSY